MKLRKFQMGGEVAPSQEGAAQSGQPGPEEQITAMATQIVQQLGPEAAAMLAQVIMQMLQGGGAPQSAPQGEPVYAREGGKLVFKGRQ